MCQVGNVDVIDAGLITRLFSARRLHFTNDLHCLKIEVEPTIFSCRVENKFFTFLVPFLVKLGNTNKVRNNKLIDCFNGKQRCFNPVAIISN